jgi:hypothetical protein
MMLRNYPAHYFLQTERKEDMPTLKENFKEIVQGLAEGDVGTLGKKIVRCTEIVQEEHELTDLESKMVTFFQDLGKQLSGDEDGMAGDPPLVNRVIPGKVVQTFNPETGECIIQRFAADALAGYYETVEGNPVAENDLETELQQFPCSMVQPIQDEDEEEF